MSIKNPLDKDILRIAIPSVVNNITVPLLGLADLAIAGHIGTSTYIAAIAVATTFFNIMYWLMGFLRMSTSGLAAQAVGAKDTVSLRAVLLRSVIIAMTLALAVLLFQHLLWMLALGIMSPSALVKDLASQYFHVVVWGAPATLSLLCLNGWFIGLQKTRVPMTVAIVQNILNIVASIAFTLCLDMGIKGLAWGTLIAQWSGFMMTTWVAWRHLNKMGGEWLKAVNTMMKREDLRSFFTLNRDIFLRTACLVSVNFGFTAFGSRQGDIVLAANTLLMTFFTLYSYVMDGFAYAGEALAGAAKGAGCQIALHNTTHHLFKWGCCLAIAATLLSATAGRELIVLLTNDETVRHMSYHYMVWACLIPISGTLAFILDGICVGLTLSRPMLTASFMASMAFFLIALFHYCLSGIENFPANHVLWLAFDVYLALRGGILYFKMERTS